MQLEGVVTNVTTFGAFVDIGVKQDGLVHVSQLADRWVEDPREVVQVGQVVRVRVVEVDKARGRIGLSMRSDGGAERTDGAEGKRPHSAKGGQRPRGGKPGGGKPPSVPRKPSGPATLQDLARKFNRR